MNDNYMETESWDASNQYYQDQGPSGNYEDVQTRREMLTRVLYDLNSTIISKDRRLLAIKSLIDEVNHDDQVQHDEELDADADKVLYQKLAFALAVDKRSEEVGWICSALEMVYRGSRNRVSSAFHEIGMDVLPILMQIIETPVSKQQQQQVVGEAMERGAEEVKEEDLLFDQERDLMDASGEVERREESLLDTDGVLVPFNHEAGRKQQDESNALIDMSGSKASQGSQSGNMGHKTFETTTVTHERTLTGEVKTVTREVRMETTRSHGVEVETVDDESTAADSSRHGRRGVDTEPIEMFPQANQSYVPPTVPAAPPAAPPQRARAREPEITFDAPTDFVITDDDDDNDEENKQRSPDQDTDEDKVNIVGVYKTLKILRYYSRVLAAMIPIAHHPNILDSLLHQLHNLRSKQTKANTEHLDDNHDLSRPAMQQQGEEYQEEGQSSRTIARINTVAIMVNLACAEDNKVMMATHPHLLDYIIDITQNDASQEAREHASIVLMNLSYADENKPTMIDHPQLFPTLISLINDKSQHTRRYAANTLFALVGGVTGSKQMAICRSAQVLEALRQVLLNDPTDETRICSAEAIFNLSRSNTDETIHHMADHPHLLDSIAHAVATDFNSDVRLYCARSLEWIAADIHHPMPSHRHLLNALIKASQWTKSSSVAEAIKIQSSLQENQTPMVDHPGMLDTLTQLASPSFTEDHHIRACALAAIERLSSNDENKPKIARHGGIVQALTAAAHHSEQYDMNNDEQSSSSYNTKRALKNLAGYM